MKKLIATLAFFALFIGTTVACNLTFSLLDSKGNVVNPQKVKTGDTYTLVMTYSCTHGNCDIALKDTKYKTDGIKVVSATEWTNNNNVYTRKLKIQITENEKAEVSLQAIRTCDRGGFAGKFSLKK